MEVNSQSLTVEGKTHIMNRSPVCYRSHICATQRRLVLRDLARGAVTQATVSRALKRILTLLLPASVTRVLNVSITVNTFGISVGWAGEAEPGRGLAPTAASGSSGRAAELVLCSQTEINLSQNTTTGISSFYNFGSLSVLTLNSYGFDTY